MVGRAALDVASVQLVDVPQKAWRHFNLLDQVSETNIYCSLFSFHLPSFNAYPQAYVTSVGEYLLTLPQQLEPLAEGICSSDPNADEAQFFATEWMFKVTNLYCSLHGAIVEDSIHNRSWSTTAIS
uniref:Conserved oligomeric Golgi complex subunit 7 n=1 Tax=Vitis vinifera TaxID=29760 RepID=F6H3M2_VITVI